MQPVMSVADVREFERALVEKGTPLAELMRRAGAVVAVQAARFVQHGSVVVLCGMGNNGGDGWVAADNLARHGYEVSVVAPATPAVMKSELARRMATRATDMGVPVHVAPTPEELEELLLPADVVIDACFGIGFHGALPEPYETWVQVVDEIFDGHLVSVDVPSGIDATSGMADGAHFDADVTVTMFAAKPGLVSGRGRAASGRVVVASLTDDDEGLQDISDAAAAFVMEERDYLDVLPEPDPLQDKYTRGRVVVVAGSSRYPGAAIMAATAAARSGAGYVTLVVPAPVVPVAQMHLLSVPVIGLPADPEGAFSVEAADRVAALVERADAVLAGPGMTTSLGACEVVRNLLRTDRPLVLDADALNAAVRICAGSAAAHPDALRREAPLVLTPHRRELARLMGGELERTQTLAGAMEAAQDLAWAVGSANFCVIAKGPVSAVATIDSTLIPQPGPVALATAGTGDVLAGMTASLLAQFFATMDEEERAEGIDSSDLLMLMAGADRVHAVAGELACRAHGSRGVMAPDVADVAGKAIDELLRRAERDFDEASDDPGTVLEGDATLADEEPAVKAAAPELQGASEETPAAASKPEAEPERQAGAPAPTRRELLAAAARRRTENVLAMESALVEDVEAGDLEEPTPEHERLERRPKPEAQASDGAQAPVAGESVPPEDAGAAEDASAQAVTPDEPDDSDEKAAPAAAAGDIADEPADVPAPEEDPVPAPAGATTVMAPVSAQSTPDAPAAPDVPAPAAPLGATGELPTAVPASETGALPAQDASSTGQLPAPAGPAEDVATDASGVPPFLAKMAAFVAEGSVPNGETGAFEAVAAAVEAREPESEPATPPAPASTASRLPAFLSAALSARPTGRSVDPQAASEAPATFDASIRIAPPPMAAPTQDGDADATGERPASGRALKRGRSTASGLPKKKPNPVEAFHERATLRIGEKPAIPPDQRPSAASKTAKPKPRPKRGKRS
ncbi:MAG: NAD(P)H-hydrate dehydratase [Coriobacteriia bacterium]|nr:NAD(P)H-hydrate dehydratase [Coriobacteriia bacterium]